MVNVTTVPAHQTGSDPFSIETKPVGRLYALAMASDLAGILSGNRAALPVYRFAQGALRCRVAAVAVHTCLAS